MPENEGRLGKNEKGEEEDDEMSNMDSVTTEHLTRTSGQKAALLVIKVKPGIRVKESRDLA